MGIITAIITIVWSILGIILFLKIWRMTNNVKEIHDWLMGDRFINLLSSNENPPRGTAHSEKVFDKLSDEAISSNPFNEELKKGDKVTIADYGTCTFEGVWEGKYAFYPENKTDLPSSPYLINDVEPYLLIPQTKLTSMII